MSNIQHEVADWLVELGYPFDWTTDTLPPEWLRSAIEDAWVRKDGPEDADVIRDCVAEEGRWSTTELSGREIGD